MLAWRCSRLKYRHKSSSRSINDIDSTRVADTNIIDTIADKWSVQLVQLQQSQTQFSSILMMCPPQIRDSSKKWSWYRTVFVPIHVQSGKKYAHDSKENRQNCHDCSISKQPELEQRAQNEAST